jgi:hypothetical protein
MTPDANQLHPRVEAVIVVTVPRFFPQRWHRWPGTCVGARNGGCGERSHQKDGK